MLLSDWSIFNPFWRIKLGVFSFRKMPNRRLHPLLLPPRQLNSLCICKIKAVINCEFGTLSVLLIAMRWGSATAICKRVKQGRHTKIRHIKKNGQIGVCTHFRCFTDTKLIHACVKWPPGPMVQLRHYQYTKSHGDLDPFNPFPVAPKKQDTRVATNFSKTLCKKYWLLIGPFSIRFDASSSACFPSGKCRIGACTHFCSLPDS